MQIEILVTDSELKSGVLTHLAKIPAVRSRGNELELDGLRLEIGEEYLFFTITRWAWAEELAPLLFSIKPAHAAHIFRLESGMKVLVTAPARPVREIIPALAAVEHLDLAAGDLAGSFQVAWSAHDVAVLAQADLMVQAGVGVAKIRFVSQARDTEYHCREVLRKISFKEVLAVFSRESLEEPPKPVLGPIVLEGRVKAPPDRQADFVNRQGALPLSYCRTTGELRLELGPESCLTFREGGPGEVLVRLADPGLLTGELAEGLRSLGLAELKIARVITGIALDLTRLRVELGFRLGGSLAELIRDGELQARYDAGRQEAVLAGVVRLAEPQAPERAAALYREMEELSSRVMACAR